jgi:hypothetical protein
MCRRALMVLVLACGGCSLLLGLDDPELVAVDARADSGAVDDASSVPDRDMASDASNVDGSLPIDAPCVPINDMNECTDDICTGGVPANPPLPRNTLCHDSADQCDGAGHCVDCTNSGGCGECCVCSFEQVCIPA